METTKSGMVETSHGKINYEYLGQGDKPLCVMCNGINQTTESWHKYLPRLTPHVDVLIWDYGVQGKSAHGGGDVSFATLCDDLEAVIETVQPPQAPIYLMGICFGSGTALEYAARHPQRVSGMVLTGTIVTREEAFLLRHRVMRRLFDAGQTEFMIEFFMSMMFGGRMLMLFNFMPEEKKATLMEKIRSGFTVGFTSLLKAQERHLEDQDSNVKRYAGIPARTLLISGDEDLITPVKFQKKLQDLMVDCAYSEYEGAGHLLYMEQEERFFSDAMSFLCT